MASGSADPISDLLRGGTVVVVVSDDEDIDQPPSRADIYGEGGEPDPDQNPFPQDAPLWQCCDGVTDGWHDLPASEKPNYTKLGWQAERVWGKPKDYDERCQFRAAVGILEWEPTKLPVYAVVMKIALPDSDGHTKVLMLLVEPGGNPRTWDKVIIKRLQRCVYNALFWIHLVDTQFPLFTNVNQHDLVGKALAKWVLAKPFRLSEVFIGTRSSVPLTILLLSFGC